MTASTAAERTVRTFVALSPPQSYPWSADPEACLSSDRPKHSAPLTLLAAGWIVCELA